MVEAEVVVAAVVRCRRLKLHFALVDFDVAVLV